MTNDWSEKSYKKYEDLLRRGFYCQEIIRQIYKGGLQRGCVGGLATAAAI